MTFIEERSPQIIAEYRSKLEEKVKEMMPNHQIPKLIKVDNVIEYMLIGQMVLCLEEVE